jgi:hypothetical protein
VPFFGTEISKAGNLKLLEQEVGGNAKSLMQAKNKNSKK